MPAISLNWQGAIDRIPVAVQDPDKIIVRSGHYGIRTKENPRGGIEGGAFINSASVRMTATAPYGWCVEKRSILGKRVRMAASTAHGGQEEERSGQGGPDVPLAPSEDGYGDAKSP